MIIKIFREEGWKAQVEVLEDNSDEKWESYKLKVIQTLLDSRIVKTLPDGEIFNVSALKNSGICCGMWSLSDEI